MKYNEAYNKIIDAYFKDEIKPLDVDFCFCGTLAGGESWCTSIPSDSPYAWKEYGRMEKALFSAWPEIVWENNSDIWVKGNILDTTDLIDPEFPGYEDALFQGMVNALEVLKQIHIERGEIIDETPSFTKRQLQSA